MLDWGELIVDVERDLRGGTYACLRSLGLGFATQNYEAREGVVATPSSGVGNLGMQGHDTCQLSFPVREGRHVFLVIGYLMTIAYACVCVS